MAPKFDLTPFRTPDDLLTAAIQSAGHVNSSLDICCGTGAAMAALLPITTERLVGIDFSEGMLTEAKKRFANRERPPRIECLLGNVMEMDFVREFDLAVCFGALGHILPCDEGKFIRRVFAALKPGGVFLFVTGGHPPIYSPVAAVFRAFNGIMKVRNHLRKPEFVMYYFTFLLPEIEHKLRAEGFEVDIYRRIFPEPYLGYSLVMATRPG